MAAQHHLPAVVAGVGGTASALLATVYVAIIATKSGEGTGGFSSLQDVSALFGNPWLLLAGWTHYLAFDLLVGAWEVRDARDRRIRHLLVLPLLGADLSLWADRLALLPRREIAWEARRA